MEKRTTKTKERIRQAFITLVREKGLDNMTVTDITRLSGINRGTFYLHYVDKYDLMEKLEAEAIADLKNILLSGNDDRELDDPLELFPYDAILNALIYVKNNFDFVQAIASEGGDPHFMDRVKDILASLAKLEIEKSNKLHFANQQLPADYAKEILLSSIVSIIMLWIRKDAAESPEEIADMITQAKQISPYKLLL